MKTIHEMTREEKIQELTDLVHKIIILSSFTPGELLKKEMLCDVMSKEDVDIAFKKAFNKRG